MVFFTLGTEIVIIKEDREWHTLYTGFQAQELDDFFSQEWRNKSNNLKHEDSLAGDLD